MSELIKNKSEFLELEMVHGVPKVVWCFWSGEKMKDSRALSFRMMREHIGVPVCLVTPENLEQFILKDFPLHSAFPLLSAVHQSDYIRAYLLHHYGGAWHDVKATEVSFAEVWKEFLNPQVYMVGKPEIDGGPARIHDEDGRWMPDLWRELISVVSWIGRANTPISKALIENMEAYLEENLDLLKKFPGTHPREKKIETNNFFSRNLKKITYRIQGRNVNYPLPWTVFGNIFHPLNYRFRKNILKTLPVDTIKNAGVYHR
ncbi:capsular polysaccharide synthesis protein [Aquiflexum sp.]|uniref:capsular polysaccharide synthesis protein n=1 Tax=Aquiflexum sp. TaxID=1872584 RepID=UPI003593733C